MEKINMRFKASFRKTDNGMISARVESFYLDNNKGHFTIQVLGEKHINAPLRDVIAETFTSPKEAETWARDRINAATDLLHLWASKEVPEDFEIIIQE